MKILIVAMLVLTMLISVPHVYAVSPQGNSGVITPPDTDTDDEANKPFVPEVIPDAKKEIPKVIITPKPIDVLEVASSKIKSMNKGDSAEIELLNVSRISVSNLNKIANMSIARGVTVKLVITQVIDGEFILTMKIDPVKARDLNGDINLECTTDNKRTRAIFEKHFNNEIDIVSFGHIGEFGMEIDIEINSNFSHNKPLIFYSYDSKTNKYDYIENSNHYIYKAGKLKFTTSIGGDIIISNKKLALKK